MEQLKKDIEMLEKFAREECGNVARYSEYCSVFIFGTENQKAINGIVDYKGKEVLTVASSADQYVSSMYYGAKKVDIFDINRFTYYISYLKIAAIMGLDYNEFKDFMLPFRRGRKNRYFWQLSGLKKIIGLMPVDVAYFWENALYIFKKYGLGNFTYVTDRTTQESNIVTGMPFYASEEEYYKLQDILIKNGYPKFYLSELSKIGDVVTDSYDILYFSNIIECMVCEALSEYYSANENDVEIDKIAIVYEQAMKILKDKGIILMSYRPNTMLEDCYDVLYDNDYFEATRVPAKLKAREYDIQRNADTDIVLTYCPSKKGALFS